MCSSLVTLLLQHAFPCVYLTRLCIFMSWQLAVWIMAFCDAPLPGPALHGWGCRN